MSEHNENREIAIKLSGVKKQYKLGQIGGGTLTADIQSWWARKRGMEDPNTKIGSDQRLIGKTFMALNGIDLTVYKGEALGIIGGNGAGKSTMLKLLSRVTAPSEGEIDIYGRIASMLEVGTGFNGELTGRENIYMNGAILGMTKAEIDAKMEDIIDFSEVREFIDTPVKRYSSGMYVKLAFSVAAHLDSEIMIMDEVLAVGDMAFQKKCLDKMRDAAKKEGRTVLYVSHNMNTIRQLCDRCIVLEQGKIVFEGDVEEGVGRYIGIDTNFIDSVIYTKEQHKNTRCLDDFRIESLNICSNNFCSTFPGDSIELQLQINVNKKYDDVLIRFEIGSQDGSRVTTVFTNCNISFSKLGTHSIKLKFDTSHLIPGKYIADIVAFKCDAFGNELFIDAVYPGFHFELCTSPFNGVTPPWKHQYWGHTHLHDIYIEKTSES